jgi:DNA-binding transcriptional MocR family regulator
MLHDRTRLKKLKTASYQIIIILAVWSCADVLQKLLNLPVASGVLGFFLLLFLLEMKWLKLAHVERGANLLLAKLLHERDIYLIEDDVYEELYFDHKKPLSMKYFDQKNLVLHCSSFSKTLGAGFRIGWVYAGKFSEHIQHLQLMSTLSVNSFIQNALVDYLSHRHYEKHLKTLRNTLKRLKNQYYTYLSEHLSEDYQIHYYPSGYFLWITLPEQINGNLIYEQLLEKNISIAPGSLFYQTDNVPHHIRINCSFEINERIQNALDALIQCIYPEAFE